MPVAYSGDNEWGVGIETVGCQGLSPWWSGHWPWKGHLRQEVSHCRCPANAIVFLYMGPGDISWGSWEGSSPVRWPRPPRGSQFSPYLFSLPTSFLEFPIFLLVFLVVSIISTQQRASGSFYDAITTRSCLGS